MNREELKNKLKEIKKLDKQEDKIWEKRNQLKKFIETFLEGLNWKEWLDFIWELKEKDWSWNNKEKKMLTNKEIFKYNYGHLYIELEDNYIILTENPFSNMSIYNMGTYEEDYNWFYKKIERTTYEKDIKKITEIIEGLENE